MREPVETLAAAIAPELEALGLELFDVHLTGSGRTRVVQVLVDREGGVDLDAITAASERITRLLDHRDVLPGPFALEVSSPGLERPLRRPDHYRGALGELISVKVRDTEGAIRRLRGDLEHADDTGITIATGGAAASEHIGYDDIVQARTVFEWGTASERGKGAKKVKT